MTARYPLVLNGTTIQELQSGDTLAGLTTGDVVGTTDTQTLTNKTITAVAAYETKIALSASDISLSTGTYFSKTISSATTFTVSNVPTTGTVGSFVLELTNGGSSNITWWSGVKWSSGTAPTLTSTGVDILSFYTSDGGTTWRGLVLSKDSK